MAPRERPSSCNASRSCSSRLVARAFFLLILMAVAGGIQQKLTQGSSPHRTGRGSRATRAPSLFKRLLGPRPTHFLGSTSVWSMRCGVGTLMRLARVRVSEGYELESRPRRCGRRGVRFGTGGNRSMQNAHTQRAPAGSAQDHASIMALRIEPTPSDFRHLTALNLGEGPNLERRAV